MSSKKLNTPGALHSDSACVLLHTRHAVALFEGRKKTDKKPEIYGLPRFSGSANQLYRAAQADDPWADWWLVKIDEATGRAEEKLAEFKTRVEAYYPANKNIKLPVPESDNPLQKPLEFGTPYPYRIAYLIVEFDELCTSVRGLVHAGLLKKALGEKLINQSGSPIRAALQATTGYRFQGVTRNDVAANNPKAQKANLLMGEIPEDILNMKRRSDFAPELPQYQDSEVSGAESSDSEVIPSDEASMQVVNQ
jgi:integrating conjugative element protein (TIGR03761 family)